MAYASFPELKQLTGTKSKVVAAARGTGYRGWPKSVEHSARVCVCVCACVCVWGNTESKNLNSSQNEEFLLRIFSARLSHQAQR
jgi:hypothetical protein